MSNNQSFSSKKQPESMVALLLTKKFLFSQFNQSFSGRPRRRPLETSDGIFDAPQSDTKLPDETKKIVEAVSPNWGIGALNEKTLALYIPYDQDVCAVSKKNFVDLLEFAEEKLEMDRVLAVFEKSRVVPTEGFARTLRYVGFRPYTVDEHPAELSPDKYFIMSYKV